MADFDKVILPGKEGKIFVNILGHKISPGHFSKNFTVKTNDPDNARVVLNVSGMVKRVFNFSRNLNFNGFVDEKIDMESIVTITIDDPVNLTGLEWSKKSKDSEILIDKLKADLETIEAGRKYRIKISSKGDIPPGNYLVNLIVKSNFERVSEKEVPVRIVIMPDVEVQPNVLFIREMQVPEGTSKSFEKMVSIIASRGDSLKVLKVVPSSENITVNVREIKPGKAFQCKVQVRPPSETGKYVETLTFYTNYKGYEKIEVLVRGSVRVVSAGQ